MGVEIKCVVWDLDHTLWDEVLLETSEVSLKPGIREIIQELDRRGILQSIASKNDYAAAMSKLKEFGLDDYFLYPEIHWHAKSYSITTIQQRLNIGLNTFLFVDDQLFELEEVQSVHPDVWCLEAKELSALLDHPRLNPQVVTEETGRRRQLYKLDEQRNRAEESHTGPKEEFMASLQMKFMITEACEGDLQRMQELTVRTNQLNSTGITYSYEELKRLSELDEYKLLVCELTDRFGSYGKIGLALVEVDATAYHLKLLLMSCRVMSRGVGTVLLTYLIQRAREEGKRLLADFKETDKNRLMYVTYRFAGFREIKKQDRHLLLEHDAQEAVGYPPSIKVITPQYTINS